MLLWLAIKPTNLRRLLLSRKNGEPEAVGNEQMALAEIPCVGVPAVSELGEPEELPWRVSPTCHSALIQPQGRAGKGLCLSSMTSVTGRGLGS